MLLKNRAESTLLQHTLLLKMSNKKLLRENSTDYEICILIGHGGNSLGPHQSLDEQGHAATARATKSASASITLR
jgi:hypothetical protein